MTTVQLDGVRILGICAALPARSEDSLARCTQVYGDAKKALSVVKATGIRSRRVAEPGTSSLDLCVAAARRVLADCGARPEECGAVIAVTFTPERAMPCNACRAQDLLGLPKDVLAFDVNLACSGWAYGLFVAGQLARATGRKALLLDGDVQTARMDSADAATVPVMADAGTATVVAPCAGAAAWTFSFLTDGAKGETLTLPFGGTIAMDGLGIFKFVTMDVLSFVRDFMAATGTTPDGISAFVPHQANIFMIRQIAKRLGIPAEKLKLSGDVLGNSSSATVPTTIAFTEARGRLLVAGFGGGLSASVGLIDLSPDCTLGVVDYGV